MRRCLKVAVALSLTLAWLAAPAMARELSWTRLDVSAVLEADGALHVVERHEMLFDGHWNGGERRFQLSGTQALDFVGLRRVDAANGTVEVRRDRDLDDVDEYDFLDLTTLHWRSRLPDAPPFQQQTLVYELEYRLHNVLLRGTDDGTYRLHHDFGFPEREGVMRAFSLLLTLSPPWSVNDVQMPLQVTRADLQPGESVLVTLPLQYLSATPPAGVRTPAPWLWAVVVVGWLIAFAAVRLRRYLAHEVRNGRFVDLTDVDDIDQAWLDAHVFAQAPEQVGALWDNSTGAPEVGAVLARLVQEGKLESHVESGRFGRHVLHLRLLQPRADFNEYERALVDALFVDGDDTDTERVRAHYRRRNKAFDPGAILGRYLAPRPPDDADNVAAIRGGYWLSLLLASAAAIAAGYGLFVEAMAGIGETVVFVLVALAVTATAAAVVLPVLGHALRHNVASARRQLLWLLAVFALFVVVGIGLLRALDGYLQWPLYVAFAAFAAWLFNVALNAALTRTTPAHLMLRRELTAARRWFARELSASAPRLDDAWYPYLLAFGLERQMDKWFGRFGADSGTTGRSRSRDSGSQTTSSPTWSGGGGSFGGGGASGTWAAAAGSMAAGVSSASSSSGSSGGGGGGSSGGGGGGGW